MDVEHSPRRGAAGGEGHVEGRRREGGHVEQHAAQVNDLERDRAVGAHGSMVIKKCTHLLRGWRERGSVCESEGGREGEYVQYAMYACMCVLLYIMCVCV